MKIALPKRFGSRSCEGLAVVWTRIVEFLGSGAHPKSVKTYFLEITWFRQKNPLNFGEDLFCCWRSPAFGQKKTLNFWFRPENPVWISVENFFFFFFGDHLHLAEKNPWVSDFGRKQTLEFLISAEKNLWISVKTFFFGDHLILTENPPESNLRLMKIWFKFIFVCIKLPKKPPHPPFAKFWLRDCNRQ